MYAVLDLRSQFTRDYDGVLTPRWYPLRYHPEQARLWTSPARFCVVPAGRRSGKTELGKRKLTKEAIRFNAAPDGFFCFFAPTFRQAKNIYWRDAKAMVPPWARSRRPSETEMTIYLRNGAEIAVIGMDKPERAEGRPIDGAIVDEYGNMKEQVWSEHLRPALDTEGREGWAWLIGVPEGRNHYYKKYLQAKHLPDWDAFHWFSSDILSPDKIRAAKEELDPLTYQQEYEGSFVTFEGRAYYAYTTETHAIEPVRDLYYNKRAPLILCFDFNVAPGTASVLQEHYYEGSDPRVDPAEPISMAMGEVWIRQNSNTRMVARKIVHDWGDHEGDVYVYGDATGGTGGSAQVEGTDWDLVRQEFKQAERMGRAKWKNVYYRTDFVHLGLGMTQNPPERVRVNSVNTRMLTVAGRKRFLLDPKHCPKLSEDFEGVRLVEGGSGEIDKKHDPMLTHLSDGVGYYIVHQYPVMGRYAPQAIEMG